nr:hypothetical protein CFP56_68707 [Quercus suber]
MEVSDLIAHTKNCICIDAYLELPPNQYDPNNSPWVLLGKFITYKSIGISIILEVVNRAWRLAFQIRVSRLDNYTFMFHFQHEADMANAYCRRPWSIRGGLLVLKQWNPSSHGKRFPSQHQRSRLEVQASEEVVFDPEVSPMPLEERQKGKTSSSSQCNSELQGEPFMPIFTLSDSPTMTCSVSTCCSVSTITVEEAGLIKTPTSP